MPALVTPSQPFRPAGPGRGVRHPWTGRMRLHRRVGYRLACGLTPTQAARTEGIEEAQVEALLSDPNFAELVSDCRSLQDLPEADLLRQLEGRARFLLWEAMNEGDTRAAMFVLHYLERGRNPARVLAQGVVRLRRPPAPPAAAPPPAPAPAQPAAAPRPAPDPAERQAQRAGVNLRHALLREHGAEMAALKAAPAAQPAPAVPAPVGDCRQRRAALERRAEAPPTRFPSRPRDGRPQPRSRGP